MITYEVALDKAKKVEPKIDMYIEYPEAFIFTNSKAKGDEKWDNEVIIERKKGNIISYTDLILISDKEFDGQYKLIM